MGLMGPMGGYPFVPSVPSVPFVPSGPMNLRQKKSGGLAEPAAARSFVNWGDYELAPGWGTGVLTSVDGPEPGAMVIVSPGLCSG